MGVTGRELIGRFEASLYPVLVYTLLHRPLPVHQLLHALFDLSAPRFLAQALPTALPDLIARAATKPSEVPLSYFDRLAQYCVRNRHVSECADGYRIPTRPRCCSNTFPRSSLTVKTYSSASIRNLLR